MLPDQVFMMMDSTDFEEHMLLNALEEANNDHEQDLTKQQPLTSKSMSSMSAATAPTVDMDTLSFNSGGLDIDAFFFDDEGVGVEMVIDQDAKPPARIIEENMEKNKKKNAAKSPKKKSAASARSSPKRKNDGDAPVRVDMPGKFDVLCGQSRVCASAPGNRRFQVVLDIFAPRYDAATSKQEKMTLTKSIVASIHQAGGRFLKFKDGQWEEISDVTARDKASHALRTKVASRKRQQQEKKNAGSRSRPTHRRGGVQRSRRTSDSSITSSATDIVTESFDSNNPISPNVMSELVKHQQAFLANAEKNGEFLHPLKTLSK